jgi:hypothetical protein
MATPKPCRAVEMTKAGVPRRRAGCTWKRPVNSFPVFVKPGILKTLASALQPVVLAKKLKTV